MNAPARAKIGRPSIYSDELALTICERIASGELLIYICADDDMPAQTTVFRWLEEKPPFRECYTRARRDQAEFMVDDMVRIADTEPDANRARVRVMTRQWLAERLNASKYGAKVALTDAQGGPLAIQVVRFELVQPAEMKVIEHAAHAPQAPNVGQVVDKTEDDKA